MLLRLKNIYEKFIYISIDFKIEKYITSFNRNYIIFIVK
jgi:hypothetical protein